MMAAAAAPGTGAAMGGYRFLSGTIGARMYAVISSGGKQARVEQGQTVDVELLDVSDGDSVDLSPVLVVDGDTVLATPGELAAASVAARVLGEVKGPKITGFTYKAKTRSRRRWGHRQRYTRLEITGITKG